MTNSLRKEKRDEEGRIDRASESSDKEGGSRTTESDQEHQSIQNMEAVVDHH